MDSITYSRRITQKQIELIRGIAIDSSRPWDIYEGMKNATDVHRRLYGIIAFDRGKNPHTGRNYYNFYIPAENKKLIKDACKTGWFSKTLYENDLVVLRSIYERTQNLHEAYGNGWYPEFTVTEAAKRSGITKRAARRSLDRLIGVLGFFSESFLKDTKDGTRTFGTPYWFVPRYNVPLIEEMLHETGISPRQQWLFPEMKKRKKRNFRVLKTSSQ